MLKLLIKKEYYCWCCDYYSTTGEGRLAKNFTEKLSLNNKLYIYTVNKITKNKILSEILNYKYISPFIGVIFCWFIFLRGKKTIYINYLPFWNFFLFIFLPPKTIFGPITGGANYLKNNEFYIRRYLFPIFYKISEFFLNLRKVNIIFSTDLLKPHLSKFTIKKSIFNYVFNLISKKKKRKKNIDFLIYYRKHHNKKYFFPFDLVSKLLILNYKVHIVGDYLKLTGIINHGYISNKKVNNLLAKTYYSFVSNENVYGLFTIECINNHVKLIVNLKDRSKIKYLNENFIFINFNKTKNLKYLTIKK
jgi:hypothetical protein